MLKISFVLILIFSYAGMRSIIFIYLCTCFALSLTSVFSAISISSLFPNEKCPPELDLFNLIWADWPSGLLKQENRDFLKIYTDELILHCTYHHSVLVPAKCYGAGIWFSVLGFIFLVLSGCLQAPKIHFKNKNCSNE